MTRLQLKTRPLSRCRTWAIRILLIASCAAAVGWIISAASGGFIFTRGDWVIALWEGRIVVGVNSVDQDVHDMLEEFGRAWILGESLITVPLWSVLALLTPVLILLHLEIPQARDPECVACGYDLVGVRADVCSECGQGFDRGGEVPDPAADR